MADPAAAGQLLSGGFGWLGCEIHRRCLGRRGCRRDRYWHLWHQLDGDVSAIARSQNDTLVGRLVARLGHHDLVLARGHVCDGEPARAHDPGGDTVDRHRGAHHAALQVQLSRQSLAGQGRNPLLHRYAQGWATRLGAAKLVSGP